MSKLAQLAAARKAAAAGSATSNGDGGVARAEPAAPPTAPAGTSKLAQRMAAAKAAASVKSAAAPESEADHSAPPAAGTQDVEMSPPVEEETSPLFNFASAMSTSLAVPASGPSNFFSLLTARPKDVAPPPVSSSAGSQIHGFDGPSPDDVVLQKREKTRLGTSGPEEKVEPKKQRVA